MRDFTKNHDWLSINTATVRKSRGQDLPLTDIIEACVRRNIQAISPWRDQVAAVGLDTVAKLVKTHGLKLSGIDLDRKVLADLAVREAADIKTLVDTAQLALQKSA